MVGCFRCNLLLLPLVTELSLSIPEPETQPEPQPEEPKIEEKKPEEKPKKLKIPKKKKSVAKPEPEPEKVEPFKVSLKKVKKKPIHQAKEVFEHVADEDLVLFETEFPEENIEGVEEGDKATGEISTQGL